VRSGYFHRSPAQLGREHVRQYQLYLIQVRKLHPRSVLLQMAALRFFFLKVLKRRFSRDDLLLPKLVRRQVPIVLSPDEVAWLIDAAANLRHRTILMTLYSTGMRRSELCHLRPDDIDKERMLVRIRQGKGGKEPRSAAQSEAARATADLLPLAPAQERLDVSSLHSCRPGEPGTGARP
jgi:integrase